VTLSEKPANWLVCVMPVTGSTISRSPSEDSKTISSSELKLMRAHLCSKFLSVTSVNFLPLAAYTNKVAVGVLRPISNCFSLSKSATRVNGLLTDWASVFGLAVVELAKLVAELKRVLSCSDKLVKLVL
jgi:hypothetical protein